MSPRPWPRTIAVLLAGAGFLAFAGVDPGRERAVFAKEGPAELVSHAVLLLAIAAWLAVAGRSRGGARRGAAAMAGFLAWVLAEELDWGAVHGWLALGERIQAGVGHRNLHNALRGASYFLFALPLLAYFALPARRLGALAPVADERAAFFAVGGLSVVFGLGPWERDGQELLEGIVYALLLAGALRLLRGAAAR